LGRLDESSVASSREPGGAIKLGVAQVLEVLSGWAGFEVAEVTTEREPGPNAVGLPSPLIVIRLAPKPV
jgi:hypothetical protein